MRMTIGAKLMIGFGSLLVILLTTGLVVNRNLRTIEKDLTEITTVEEPTSAAAYEMEINVIGTGLGVLKYLDTGDPRYRARVEKDEADFERFKAQYDRLAETPKGKELGKKVGALYLEFKALGDTLMDAKDRQEALYATVATSFGNLDDIIDDKIQANIDLAAPDGPAKARQSALLEADVAEVGLWLGNYLRTPKKEHKERLFDNVEDARGHLVKFTNLRLTQEEKKRAGELESLFNKTVLLIQDILGVNESLQGNIEKFIALRSSLDDVLDEEIQVLTHKDLNLAKDDAHASVGTTRQLMIIMLIIGLLVGGGSAVVIGRGIAGPLRELVDGADRVGRGELDHRIEVKTKDEIGDLADAFNQMTEKRQDAEEELRRAHDELELRVEERTTELKAAHEEMEAFVYTISHDLRTPIITLKGYTSALLEDYGEALDETAKEYLDHIESGSTRLGEIVSNLLDLSRAGMVLGPMKTVDSSELINGALDEMAPLLEEGGVECEVDGGPFKLTCDPARFPIVLTNLLTNAVKYMGEQPNPRIEIGIEENKEEFQLYVRDNGNGIDPRYHEKIFELFQTLGKGDGTGVGLALVKKIVESHGGRVWVESAEGEGSTFFVTLPIQLVHGGEPA